MPKPAVYASARSSVLIAAVTMSGVALVLSAVYRGLPVMKEEHWTAIRDNFPPASLDSMKTLRDAVLSYAGGHQVQVGIALALVYMSAQTFAIPGTTSLSLIISALFGRWLGFILVSLISTAGASSCYLLSKAVGKPLVQSIWPEKLTFFQAEVTARRGALLNYMLFLRLTPLLPNVFINVSSPVVGVPLHTFALATLLGCAPNNFVAANAGANLSSLSSMKDLASPAMVLLGLAVGIAALIPLILTRGNSRQQSKMGKSS